MAKILITGSRGLMDVELVYSTLSNELSPEDSIITGGAFGTDDFAQKFCKANNIYCQTIRPLRKDIKDYYLHRNAEMIGMCDRVIAFPSSNQDRGGGTWFTIRYARARNKEVKIFVDGGVLDEKKM